MDKSRNEYICTKMKLMQFLVRHEFDVESIRVDKKNPSRVVFVFPDSAELRKAIALYYGDE